MKGLRVSVYRNAEWGPGVDCTNGGISSKHNQFVLVGNGMPEIFEPREDAPAIRLIKRRVMGMEFWIAAPLDADTDGRSAGSPYMFGGNFIYTSDSRFPCREPIKVFDRKE